MGLFTRRKPKVDNAARLEELRRQNRESRSPELDREVRRYRHLVGAEAVSSPPAVPKEPGLPPESPGFNG